MPRKMPKQAGEIQEQNERNKLAALSIVYREPQENPLMMAQLRAQKRAVIKGPLNFFSEGEFSFKRNG